MFKPKKLPNGNLVVPASRVEADGTFVEGFEEVAPGSPLYSEWAPLVSGADEGRRPSLSASDPDVLALAEEFGLSPEDVVELHLRTSRRRGSHNEKSHGTAAGFGADGPKAPRARRGGEGSEGGGRRVPRFDDSKKAEEWARENLGVIARNFERLDPEVANDLNAALARRMDQFPLLAEKVRVVEPVKRGGHMMQMNAGGGLEIGPDFRTPESYSKAWNRVQAFAERNGRPSNAFFHLPESKTLSSVVDHELGHTFAYFRVSRDPDLKKEWSKLFRAASKNGELKRVSDYAFHEASDQLIRGEEAFAESFSLYLNDRRDLLPTGVKAFIDKVVVK